MIGRANLWAIAHKLNRLFTHGGCCGRENDFCFGTVGRTLEVAKPRRLSNAHSVRIWKGRKGSNPGLPPFSKEAVSAYRKLACNTQQEIADAVGVDPTDKILRVSGNAEELPNNQKSAADHATDFDPPLYNVWKQQSKSNKVGHFGNTEAIPPK